MSSRDRSWVQYGTRPLSNVLHSGFSVASPESNPNTSMASGHLMKTVAHPLTLWRELKESGKGFQKDGWSRESGSSALKTANVLDISRDQMQQWLLRTVARATNRSIQRSSAQSRGTVQPPPATLAAPNSNRVFFDDRAKKKPSSRRLSSSISEQLWGLTFTLSLDFLRKASRCTRCLPCPSGGRCSHLKRRSLPCKKKLVIRRYTRLQSRQ